MILFVVDQIAGAEYIAPLLKKWTEEYKFDWKVLASPQSAIYLSQNNISHDVVPNCSAEDAFEWVERLQPDKSLISTSGNSSLENSFVRALQTKQISCAQLIDNWVNFAARFQVAEIDGKHLMLLPDFILTLDEISKQRMIKEGLPEDKIIIIGQPHWEACLHKPRTKHIKSDPNLALIATQPISHYYLKSLGYDEMDFVYCCCEAWETLGVDWQQLHLLVHPSEDPSIYNNLLKKNGWQIQIVQNTELQLSRYSLMMGMFTSMLNQSLLERVHAISVQPAATGDDKCFLSEVGFIPRFLTSKQLKIYLLDKWPFANECYQEESCLDKIVDGSLARLEDFLENFNYIEETRVS